jgi:hypothetical protein
MDRLNEELGKAAGNIVLQFEIVLWAVALSLRILRSSALLRKGSLQATGASVPDPACRVRRLQRKPIEFEALGCATTNRSQLSPILM